MTFNHSALPSPVLLLILAFVSVCPVYSQSQSTSTPSDVTFNESADHTLSFSSRWRITTNTGSVTLTPTVISLHSTGYGCPEIQTVSDPFPSGDWSISFGFRYTTVGNYGTDIGCCDSSGFPLFCVHQDVNGQFFALGDKELERSAPNNDWHVLSVVKSGQTYLAFWDGKPIGSNSFSAVPAKIAIGGVTEKNAWDWNDIDIKFVRVQTGKVICDKSALADLVEVPHLDAAGASPGSTTTTVNGIIESQSDCTFVSMMSDLRAIGLASGVVGIWTVHTFLHNSSDQPVCVVPYCFVFSDNSQEHAFALGGWQSISDTRTFGGGKYGADVPAIPMTQYYISPYPQSNPVVTIAPNADAEIIAFSEDGGSWSVQTATRVSGGMESSLTAPVQKHRDIRYAVYLEVPTNTPSLFTSVPTLTPSPLFTQCSDVAVVAEAYSFAMANISYPALTDSRWISVPIAKDQLLINPACHVKMPF